MRTNRHFCRRNMSDQSNNPIPLGEIVQGPSAFEQFLDRNQKMMAFSAIAVALGVGGFMVYKTIAKDHALSAGAAYSSAQDIADLEKVKQEYADTAASATASLAIAEKQWGNKQEDEAISTLRQLIQDFPKHPAAAIAQQTLGNRLLAQGKTGDAELAFQAVIDNPQSAYLAPAALVALGDIAKKAGDLTKAEELYKRVDKDYQGSALASLASDRIKYLHFKEPVEIEQPPVVEEPPVSIAKPDDAPAVDNPTSNNPLLNELSNPTPDEAPEESLPEGEPTAPDMPEGAATPPSTDKK